MLFLSWIIPWIRLSGRLERSEARRYRGQPGIVFGFRGPPTFQRGAKPTLGWNFVRVEIDVVERVVVAPVNGGPKWCRTSAGVRKVRIVPLHGNKKPISIDVEVGESPVVVAVWPEYKRFWKLRPARVEVQ